LKWRKPSRRLSADPHKIEQIRDMEGYKHKAGITLIETLIVVAIVVLLATMVIAIATRIGTKTNEQLTLQFLTPPSGNLAITDITSKFRRVPVITKGLSIEVLISRWTAMILIKSNFKQHWRMLWMRGRCRLAAALTRLNTQEGKRSVVFLFEQSSDKPKDAGRN